MRTLKEILKEYYDAHQISKSTNILEVALVEDITSDKLRPTKCIYDIFSPVDGWGENVEKSSTQGDKCFYCRRRIHEINKEFWYNKKTVFSPNPNCSECLHCYMFLAREFIKPFSDFRLITGKRNRKCRKI